MKSLATALAPDGAVSTAESRPQTGLRGASQSPSVLVGWEVHWSKTRGREYFLHKATGRVQWERPVPEREIALLDLRNRTLAHYETLAMRRLQSAGGSVGASGGGTPLWRKFNNFLKASLLSRAVLGRSSPLHVLDVACGSGGDLLKWSHIGAQRYTGFDLSPAQVYSLQRRIRATAPHLASAADAVFVGDMTSSATWEKLQKAGGGKAHVVSCQFALHYAFGSADDARCALSGMASALDSGGCIVATVPDAEFLLPRVAAAAPLGERVGPAGVTMDVGAAEEWRQGAQFGLRYTFSLRDCVSCDECWVLPEALQALLGAFGLRLAASFNLATFASWLGVQTTRRSPEHQLEWKQTTQPLLQSIMGGAQPDADCWALASVYRALVLVPLGAPCPPGLEITGRG